MSLCTLLLEKLERKETTICTSLRLSAQCGEGKENTATLGIISEEDVEKACRIAKKIASLGDKPELEDLVSLEDDVLDGLLDPLVSSIVSCILEVIRERGEVRICEGHDSQG